MSEIHGGCFCGAIRYRARSAPLASMVCHCQSCRRISAAPVMGWLTFQRDQFEYLQGQPTQLQSSPGVRREFCAACGTHLTYQNSKYGNEIDVTTCSLDEPGAFPPSHHSWLSHNVAWVQFGDGLPTYPQSSSSS